MKRCLFLVLVVIGLSVGSVAQTFPQVVAQVSLTGQNTPIPFTPVYTPPTTGLFRVTVYMIVTKPSTVNNKNWVPNIQWTDEQGLAERPVNIPQLPVNSKPPFASISFTETFEAAASQPIGYGMIDGAASSTYSLYVTVEQLQ